MMSNSPQGSRGQAVASYAPWSSTVLARMSPKFKKVGLGSHGTFVTSMKLMTCVQPSD
jgi:hypothetical protein